MAPGASGTLETGPYTIAADGSPAVFGPTASTQVTTDEPVDLRATLSVGAPTVLPGEPIIYTLTIANAGTAAVPGAVAALTLPTGVAADSWTCTASAGSSCGAASGTGAFGDAATIAPGESITYTVTASAASVVPGATLSALGRVTLPAGFADTDPSNDTDLVDQTVTAWSTDLAIQWTRSGEIPGQGAPVAYRLVVTNHAAHPVSQVVPTLATSDLAGIGWTCTASTGGTCAAASGTGTTLATLTLAAGGTATYDFSAAVAPGRVVGDTVATAVSVAVPAGHVDPVPANNAASDAFVVAPWNVDVQTAIQTPTAAVRPGEPVEYVISVTNASARGVPDVHVTLPGGVPPELADVTWACTALGAGTSCVNPATSVLDEHVTLGPYSVVRYTLTGAVAPLVGAGQVFALNVQASLPTPGAFVDGVPANNAASASRRVASSQLTAITPTAGLAGGGTLVEIVGTGFLSV